MSEEKKELSEDLKYLHKICRSIPDYPQKGILFRDITTILKDPKGLRIMVDQLYNRYKSYNLDYIVGLESRGFVLAAPLAYKLNAGLILIRKKGKLPVGKDVNVHRQKYGLEYGTDEMEIHTDAIEKGKNVLIMDDLIATGGTFEASIKLVEKLGGNIVECACMIELPELEGRKKLMGKKLFTLLEMDDTY